MSRKPKADPAARKVLAYSVETNDPEESTIQFATSNAAARRQGADEIGADFGDVSCRHAQWADQYASQSFMPAEVYIDAGWWFDCNHCGTRCDSDASRWNEETEADIPLDLVFNGRVVYCSAECKASHEAEVASRNARFEAFKARVVAAHPSVTFTEFTGGYPHCGDSARFTFPGARFGGSVSQTEDAQDLKWYVAQGDKATWDCFIAERPAGAARRRLPAGAPYSITFYRWAAHCHGQRQKHCRSYSASSRLALDDWKARGSCQSLSPCCFHWCCPSFYLLHLWT